MGGGGGPEYLKLARRLLVIIGIGHGERARRRKLPAQQRHPTRLVKREIVLLHPGGGQQGGDGPLVHVGILPERSEEHTSELQSLMRISYAVFCLKKKITKQATHSNNRPDIEEPK